MIDKLHKTLMYYGLLSIFLIILFVFLVIQNIQLSNKNISTLKDKDYVSTEKNLVIQYFWQRIFVDPDKVVLDIASDSILYSIAGDSHLALWISDKQCSECVEFTLAKLHDLPVTLKSKVIIFSDYENPRLRKIISEKISDEFFVFDYRFSNKGSLYKTPFIGIVSPNLEVSKIFFPAKELPQLTDYYLSKIFNYIY